MQVQLITPEATFFSGDAQLVQVPGTLGDFGVLDGHAPFLSTIRPGVITIETAEGARKMAVAGGIAEVQPERLILLAESAQDVSAFSASDAQARVQEAKALLADVDNDAERTAAELKLAVAEAIALAV